MIHEKGKLHLEKGHKLSDEPDRPQRFPEVTPYVDDYQCRSGHDTESEHTISTTWMRWWLAQHGFCSSKICSNVSQQAAASADYLGYRWDPLTDKISNNIPARQVQTGQLQIKQLVGEVAALFDPLGRTLRHQLWGRQLIRRAFEEAKQDSKTQDPWDYRVSEELKESLEGWKENILKLKWSEPRRLDFSKLYVFADSSSVAWAYTVHDANLKFVFARGGLTDPKMTIPHAELTSIFHAVKDLSKWDMEKLDIQQITFVSDSSCTLQRLRRQSGDIKATERNKISLIIQTLEKMPIPWSVRHIYGTHNFADIYSRPGPNIRMEEDINREETLQLIEKSQFVYEKNMLKNNMEETMTSVIKDSILRMILRSDTRQSNTALVTQIIPPSVTYQEVQGEQETCEEADPQEQDIGRNRQKVDFPEQLRRSHGEEHHGINATVSAFKRKGYEAPNNISLRKAARDLVRQCEICQRTRASKFVRTAVGRSDWLHNLNEVQPGMIVGIDICTLESKKPGRFSCCLTVTCAATKWIRTAPLKTELATEVTETLTRIFDSTCYPHVIISDGGSCFRSRKFQMFLVSRNIQGCLLPPYASAYAGWIERSHFSIQSTLKTLIAQAPHRDWDELLPRASHICNSRPYELNDPTGLCPLDMAYGGTRFTLNKEIDHEQLLKRANLLHLLPPQSAAIQAAYTKGMAKRKRLLQKYEYLWTKRRAGTRQKLLNSYHTKTEQGLEVGQLVRVFRPAMNKLAVEWSEPRRIMSSPSNATRWVQKPDGTASLEYLVNLTPVDPHDCESGPSCPPPQCSVQGSNYDRG
jgi:hypothetical protein